MVTYIDLKLTAAALADFSRVDFIFTAIWPRTTFDSVWPSWPRAMVFLKDNFYKNKDLEGFTFKASLLFELTAGWSAWYSTGELILSTEFDFLKFALVCRLSEYSDFGRVSFADLRPVLNLAGLWICLDFSDFREFSLFGPEIEDVREARESPRSGGDFRGPKNM